MAGEQNYSRPLVEMATESLGKDSNTQDAKNCGLMLALL
jgi:hypothetical protein